MTAPTPRKCPPTAGGPKQDDLDELLRVETEAMDDRWSRTNALVLALASRPDMPVSTIQEQHALVDLAVKLSTAADEVKAGHRNGLHAYIKELRNNRQRAR